MKRLASTILLFLCSGLAWAQTDAMVSGTITDPSGASIVNASVQATHTGTGIVSKALSNHAGVYNFAALPPGIYRFSAEHAGFRGTVMNNVTLEVGGKVTLNMALQVGQTSEVVEVSASAVEVNTSNANVGSVVSGRKILELPLAGRSSYDLLTTQAGVYGANVSGNRTGSLNVTTDGINAQDNLLNGIGNIGIANQIRVDRVEEFRIVTSSTDVELGRGSGQIQVVTRSGSNAFHGSVFEEHRNTALNANTWFNNQRGKDLITGAPISPRDILLRNQYGGRLGGPIKKNKTFFHGYYEGERQRQKNATTATVLTPTARQGIFRFYPGAQNANANATVPTVDLQGNPLKPATATGDLQSVNIFGRDPNRLVPDATGIVTKQLSYVPLPNGYRAGDGLNTAGYTWARPVQVNFETYEVRVDHNFNSSHRMSASFSHQAYDSLNVTGPQPLPASPGGRGPTETTQYSTSVTSILRPNLLNEFRAGVFRPRTEIVAPYDPASGFPDILPRFNNIPFIIDFVSFTEPVTPQNFGADNSNRISPVYQWGDNISWLKGRHSFKGGVEFRWVSSAGYDAFAVTTRTTIGAVPAVSGITTIPLIGQNSGGASGLLTDLTGTLSSTFQVYNSPGGPNPVYLPGQTRYRNWSQHEFSGYFKDEFKMRPNLTLNMGLRYEWYAVPHERQSKALAPVGSERGLFGISGTGFADMFQPGRLNGALTVIQPVGPGTANPDTKLYNNDNNNFAPGIGVAWSPSWLGKNKTVVRAGYGISYERNPIYLTHDTSGLEPGYSETPIYTQATLMTLANPRIPPPTSGPPLTPIPLTQRTAAIKGFDQNLRNPYIQNYNFSITRSLPGNSWLDVRYVGTKGSKLVREANINEINTIENGILDAYRITQAGGNAPLFDKIFLGLPGVPATTVSGSDFVRSFTTTNAFLINNNVAGLASYISSTTNFGAAGLLLRRVGLPENSVVVNPQVASATLASNFDSSSYHSLQVEFTKRSDSFVIQSNYTFSRNLGSYDGEDSALGSTFRTLRNRSLDKKLLGYHRAHIFRTNGIYELPFGPGKLIGRNSRGIIGKVIGGFQAGFIFNVFSGPPLTFGAVNAFNTAGGATPVIVGQQPSGHVTMTGNGPVYFTGLQQGVDPYVAKITTLQGLQARSTMRAISDSSGLLLVNPQPGQFGTLGLTSITGPGAFRLDINLLKRIKITERIEFTIRADAINLTNTPNWANPSLDINSTNFGRITDVSGNSGAPSNRLVVIQGRVTF